LKTAGGEGDDSTDDSKKAVPTFDNKKNLEESLEMIGENLDFQIRTPKNHSRKPQIDNSFRTYIVRGTGDT